jgi:hypothetical protein
MTEIIDTWFRLRAQMLEKTLPNAPSAVRPPSLRDACYAWVLSQRNCTDTSPEVIESYVNGLELGTMLAIKAAWEKYNA